MVFVGDVVVVDHRNIPLKCGQNRAVTADTEILLTLSLQRWW